MNNFICDLIGAASLFALIYGSLWLLPAATYAFQ